MSPFAALAHSPHESDGATLADASAASVEDAQQGDAVPSDHGHQIHQQTGPFGSAHDMPVLHDVDTEQLQQQQPQQPQQQHIGESASDVHEDSNEHAAYLQSASSSDSRQNFRRKGRPKCVVM